MSKIHHFGPDYHWAHASRSCDERCADWFPEMPVGEPCEPGCEALKQWGYK